MTREPIAVQTRNGIVDVYPIDHDVNGNPRYVVHYLAIPFTEYAGDNILEYRAHQIAHVDHAKRALYGKRYRAKSFGGGIVFQSFNIAYDVNRAIDRGAELLAIQ